MDPDWFVFESDPGRHDSEVEAIEEAVRTIRQQGLTEDPLAIGASGCGSRPSSQCLIHVEYRHEQFVFEQPLDDAGRVLASSGLDSSIVRVSTDGLRADVSAASPAEVARFLDAAFRSWGIGPFEDAPSDGGMYIVGVERLGVPYVPPVSGWRAWWQAVLRGFGRAGRTEAGRRP